MQALESSTAHGDPAASLELDHLAEWERAEREVWRLEALVEALGSGGAERELRALSTRHALLEGRLNQLLAEAARSKEQARRQGALLRQVCKVLQVERPGEIVPTLVDMLR